MKRREFIRDSAVAAAGAGMVPGILRAGSRPPNVLLIMVDQMRQSKWTPQLSTPNIDRIAQSGVSFTNHFISASPCSPSRACILTGTHTTQNGMYINCDFLHAEKQPSLDPRIPTLGHIFSKAGYQTPYRGKWHLSLKESRDDKDPLIDYGFTGWNPPDALFGGPPYSGALQDPFYARQAARWLRQPENHKRPWFLVCSLVNPHDICSYPLFYPQRKLRPIKTEKPPPNWLDDLSDKPGCQKKFQELYNKLGGYMDETDDDEWRRYLDYYIHCTEDADGNVGDVLDALDESGQRDNTVIAFISDHGDMGGSHRLRAKGCFAYEEEINVPLIFSAPGLIPMGKQAHTMASIIDLMPTLFSLAGITSGLPYMPGIDLTPALVNPETASLREEVIFNQDSELFRGFGNKDSDVEKYPVHIRCLRDKDWKYAYYFEKNGKAEEYELYNMADDPLEMTNLAGDPGYLKKRKEMHGRLMEREERLKNEFEI